jgi:hypothetical protein
MIERFLKLPQDKRIKTMVILTVALLVVALVIFALRP